MKRLALVSLVLLMGAATSCYQKTCPTYTRAIKKAPVEQPVQLSVEKKI